jgi:uncharacterized BrkB/YihY/UPF0761 family membrane protein
MRLFNRLPGFQRAPAGLEWWLLRRMPLIAAVGTVVPVLCAIVAYLVADGASSKLETTIGIALASVLALHWTAVFTAGLACVIVTIAKGPAYVADAYDLPDFDR